MKPHIVFFGTGPISLQTLHGIQDDFELEAIITKPDRVGPGGQRHDHPVKAWAEAHTVRVFQVGSKAELATVFAEQTFSSRVGLVVDFGLIIPPVVIDSFELGIINSHFSWLPLLRGADPISFAILEGLEETGVSLMKIAPELDTGDLIAQEKLRLPGGITTSELDRELGELSNRMLIENLPRYIAGAITPWPQDPVTSPTYTRKLTKADGVLDWRKPAARLEREIRSFGGWPGSQTEIRGVPVTVTAAHVSEQPPELASEPGYMQFDGRHGIAVLCGDDKLLVLDRLKPAGKAEMSSADFLRGLRHP